jgi:hypothetical protein
MFRTRSRSAATCSSSAAFAYDRFDLTSQNLNPGGTVDSRVDDLVSPRAGVIIKPVDNVSVYGSYSISYLPSAGDQFSSLTPSLAVTVPEKFINNEVGVKWDIHPRLQASAAIYDLDRKISASSENGLRRIRQDQHQGLRTQPDRLRHRSVAGHGRLRLYRRPHRRCQLRHDRLPATASAWCRSIPSPCGTSISSTRCGVPASVSSTTTNFFATSDDTVLLKNSPASMLPSTSGSTRRGAPS